MFAIRLSTGRGSPRGCYFCLLVFAVGLMGCMETINHDASSAGKKAEEFAQVVLVKQDVENGYGLLADGTKRYVSREQFKAVVSKLHPNAFPKTVTALEYEPMPGEKAIYVFLTGENSGEHFYYRLTMEGTATTGYKVLRFDRASQPYPPSNEKKRFSGQKERPWLSRQLLVLRSTDGLSVHSTTFSDLSLPLGRSVSGFRLVTAQSNSSPFEIP